MAWFYLFIAGLCEIVWVFTLRKSEGFTDFYYAGMTLAAMAASMVFLGLAIKTLPLGTSYAVWTGIGIVGAFIMGYFFFKEDVSLLRFIFAACIIAGIIGLKITTPST